MKYKKGDVVKIKKLQINGMHKLRNRVAIILEVLEQTPSEYAHVVPAYRVLIAGIEGRKYSVYEDEIEGVIE
jgi:hypothetical protein